MTLTFHWAIHRDVILPNVEDPVTEIIDAFPVPIEKYRLIIFIHNMHNQQTVFKLDFNLKPELKICYINRQRRKCEGLPFYVHLQGEQRYKLLHNVMT